MLPSFPAAVRLPSLAGALLLSLLAACDSRSGPEAEPANAAASAEPEEPALRLPKAIPTPAPELDRAGLLAAVARAASAHTAGRDDRQAQTELAGRRFTLKIRFGCGGPAGAGPPSGMSWQYDEAAQRLTIRARPDIAAEAAGLETPATDAGEKSVEAFEGFWIPQPWLLTDACPAGEADEPAGPAPPPTVGVAQYFTGEDSRVQRRSQRSYEIVRRAEPAILPPSGGFNLVLEGRLSRWPQGRVIRCRGSGRQAPPVCIVSAAFDRVAFENPESGQTVAQWSAG
jgi:hypothetical protein